MAGKSPISLHLESIYISKEDLLEKEGNLFLKDYVPFVINRCLSKHIDTLVDAQMMNVLGDIPKDMHYQYLLYSVRKGKRFSKFAKANVNPNTDLIKRHYKCNDVRATEILKLLNENDIELIREQYKNDE